MTEGKSRRIVIDADVVTAAGSITASHPTAVACREFLITSFEECHRVVITQEIECEWRKHSSQFAIEWRADMESHGKVERIAEARDDSLRENIRLRARSKRRREAMLKDVHLIEAALKTDQTVASLEREARECSAEFSRVKEKLGRVVWVNPATPDEQPVSWLKTGAKPEKKRMLGFQVTDA